MTRKEAIALRPQSTLTYGWELCIGVLLSTGFLAALLWSRNFRARGLNAVNAIIFLAGVTMAAQAWERLFAPICAAERSAGLSDVTRATLHQLGSVCRFLGLSIAFVGSIGHMMTESHHGAFGDMTTVGWLIYFIHPMLADLCGEKPFRSLKERMNIAAGQTIDWRQWNPIRSDHWGER